MDLAAYYDAYWSTHGDNFDQARLELIARQIRPGESVLEVDCGPGVLASKMVARGAKVQGTDISQVAAERARQRGIPTRVVNLDLETLPFPDESFDVVVSNSMLEHRFFPERSLQEGLRVLKQGGRYIVCLPNNAHWLCRLWLLFGRFPYLRNSPTDPLHLRSFTVHEAKSLCRRFGARPVALDGSASLWAREFYPNLFRRPPIRELYNRLAHFYPSLFARDFVLVCRKEQPTPPLDDNCDSYRAAGRLLASARAWPAQTSGDTQ